MPGSADHFVGRQEPGNDATKEQDDTEEKYQAQGLASAKGLVTHLDDDVDEHPHGHEDADEGDGEDGQRPGATYERLVGEGRNGDLVEGVIKLF